jgi:hypothetical protein
MHPQLQALLCQTTLILVYYFAKPSEIPNTIFSQTNYMLSQFDNFS